MNNRIIIQSSRHTFSGLWFIKVDELNHEKGFFFSGQKTKKKKKKNDFSKNRSGIQNCANALETRQGTGFASS